MSDIQAFGTLVRLPTLMFTVGPKLMKHTYSPNSAPNDQCGKRAHAETKGASISNWHSPPPIQSESDNGAQPKTVPAASHSSDQPEPELINLAPSPVKGDDDPDNVVVVEVLGSTGEKAFHYQE